MNCTICNQPIVLVPSAKERAKRYGGTAAYYQNLFRTHPACLIRERESATRKLIARKPT